MNLTLLHFVEQISFDSLDTVAQMTGGQGGEPPSPLAS